MAASPQGARTRRALGRWDAGEAGYTGPRAPARTPEQVGARGSGSPRHRTEGGTSRPPHARPSSRSLRVGPRRAQTVNGRRDT